MDFDGVLVRDDSLGAFLRHHVLRAPWRIPGVLVASYAAAPLLGPPTLRPHGLRLIVRSLLAGWDLEAFETRAAAFGAQLAVRDGALLTGGLAAARFHLDRGDRLVVVTGSAGPLARAVLDAAGLERAELVASRIGARRGGLALDLHNYGPAKVVQLAEAGIAPPWDMAYSDSLADLPMLAGARRPVLVGGGARTLARAREALGPAVVQVHWR
nr:haloacid dehalogenase-like hydrolase [Patulibacter sp. SYSU D01012]